MPWPRRRSSLIEVQLKRENDALALKLLRANSELATKTRYASRLEFLLRQRLERIDELTAQVDQVRMQNRKLDAEADRWAMRYAQECRA